MSSENTAYCQNRNGRHFTLPSNAAFGSNDESNTPPVMSSENTAYCQNRNGRHFTLPSNAAFGSNDESNNQWS